MTIFEIDAAYIGDTPVEKIYLGAEVIYEEGPSYRTMPLTIKVLEDGTLKTDMRIYQPSYSYSINDGAWVDDCCYREIQLSSGDTISFRASGQGMDGFFENNELAFEVYGNVMSLVYGENFIGQTSLSSVLDGLFSGCTGLTDASNLKLPARVLANYCYQSMFEGCTSLTAAPELPARVFANYCYSNMFKGCTSLTTAPDLLATTVQNPQYSYAQYNHMFSGCTSLNYIKCLAEDGDDWLSEYGTLDWTAGVAATGTFVKSRNATIGGGGIHGTWGRSADGIPPGWTVVDA